MTVFAAFLLVGCIIFVLSNVIIRMRPMPLSGALSISFAAWIAFETILLNILSLFGAINKNWVITFHVVLLLMWFVFTIVFKPKMLNMYFKKYFIFCRRVSKNQRYYLLLPLLILIGISAWLYPPNNYDSLTYHMSRVVHWMQNKSIDYYPTPNDRQNVMGPGAEYLILVFQLITYSDFLANFIQYISFIFLIISISYISRILRLPGKWVPYVTIIASTAPIAIMQASNTKNDLIAALMSSAILISSARLYLGSLRKMNYFEFILIGMCFASGYLVKPTSLLITVPVILLGIVIQMKPLIRKGISMKRLMVCLSCFLVTIAIIAGPDLYRKSSYHINRHELYPMFSKYDSDRMWNPVRVLAHNIPFRDEMRSLLKNIGYRGDLITKDVFHLHEDMIGNPFQILTFLILTIFTMGFSIAIYFYPFLWIPFILSLTPVMAWFFFGIIIRDQGWITRLTIPFFFILPFSFIFFASLSRKNLLLKRLITVGLVSIALPSLAYAFLVACKVPARPIIPHYFWGEKPGRIPEYYNNAGVKDIHDIFLSAAVKSSCDRIGLIMGPDSPEYPLIWRLRLLGKHSKHLRNTTWESNKTVWFTESKLLSWPCMIYASDGVLEHIPGENWLSAGDGHTFHRNLKWDYDRSDKILLSIAIAGEFKPLNHADVYFEIDKLIIDANGEDPQILFPKIEPGKRYSAILKIGLRSPAETVAQLFYKTADIPDFTENKSIKRKVSIGDNEIYFQLPIDELIDKIRFDPGQNPGIYQLDAVEVRGLD